jgi:hypothetical protein
MIAVMAGQMAGGGRLCKGFGSPAVARTGRVRDFGRLVPMGLARKIHQGWRV